MALVHLRRRVPFLPHQFHPHYQFQNCLLLRCQERHYWVVEEVAQAFGFAAVPGVRWHQMAAEVETNHFVRYLK